MNPAAHNPKSVERAPRGGIYRLLIGTGLLAISIWGFSVCRATFQTSLGPAQSPADPGFVSLGAWAAWCVFFGPVATAGFLTIWFTLRKMAALEKMSALLEKIAGRSVGLLAGNNQLVASGLEKGNDDPHGLESLSTEKIKQLESRATRAAFLLGVFAGVTLLGIGVFGLVCLSSVSKPYSSALSYVPLGTGRITITLAVLSGMSLLLGLAVLQRTLRRENNAWMLPLRVFTFAVLRREKASPSVRSTAHPPDTKLLP